jgi:hypothetical protein
MTVEELIETLQTLPKDAIVCRFDKVWSAYNYNKEEVLNKSITVIKKKKRTLVRLEFVKETND